MSQSTSLAAVAIVGFIALAWLHLAFQKRRLVAHLRTLRDERSPEHCLNLCIAAFPEIDRNRVVAAYKWVQELVAILDMPLKPEDDLSSTLRIDQGEVDGKFEASYECYGPEADGGEQSSKPVHTVQELMAAVLASGYEFYPQRNPEAPATNAA